MLMQATLAESAPPFQPKNHGPAERSGSAAKSGAKRGDPEPHQATKENRRTVNHFHPKSSSLFCNFPPDLF
jgi:hypothetical protein